MDPIRAGVLVILVAIVLSMASAMRHLTSKNGDPDKMLRALTIRIGLSVALFLLLMAGWYLGYIHPHEIMPAQPR